MQYFTNKAVGSEIAGTWFGFYTKEEILKLSVKEITNPKSIDELGAHVKDGLYDPALGSFSRSDICDTCGLGEEFCPGHCGHIQLSVPLYHPILFQILYKLLRCVCFGCHQLRVPDSALKGFITKMKLLQDGKLVDAMRYVSPGEIDFATKTIGKELLDGTKIQKQPKSKKKKMPNSTDKLVNRDTLLMNAVTEIKNLLGDFFKEMNTRKCFHCKAYNPPLRKDETKIFQQGIPASYVKLNRALGIDVTTLSGEDVDYLQAIKPKEEQDRLNEKKADEEDEEEKKDEEEYKMIDSEDSEEEGEGGKKKGKEDGKEAKGKKEIVFTKRDKSRNINVGAVESSPGGSSARVTQESEKARYITTSEAKQRLIRFFINEREAMECLFKSVFPTIPGCQRRRVDPNMFFLEVLLIPPSRFRPPNKGAMGEMEHAQNVYFKQILQYNKTLYNSMRIGEVDSQTMVNQVVQMQNSVNLLMDSSKGPEDTPNGIKQLLEKKQGLFRKNMMGKRVNFAARSVISPDPYLYSNQIGVPEVFAKKLTFEEPVTDWNYKKLAQMVINGPDVHPGANAIVDEQGRRIILKGGDNNIESRKALSKTLLTHNPTNASHLLNKKVLRHLIDNDIVIMNRQPTLHKPSMMTMKTVVQKGERVIRMHYANCKTFNADFDGDEMNMHFPQTQQARADAVHIMFSDKQYITATSGTPLRGLIQDHVVSGVLLTKRDTFFTKDEFQQLFYQAVAKINDDELIIPPPCILKPKSLWSGKQIITAILKHLTKEYPVGLNLDAKAQIGKEMWGGDVFEQMVIIRDSELLTGVLDKAQFGSSTYSLVHAVYELYGPTYAGQLLSTFGRLFTIYLQYYGFTCGIDDLIISSNGDKARTEKLSKGDIDGLMVATQLSNYDSERHSSVTEALRETLLTDADFEKLDNLTKAKVNNLTTEVISAMIPKEQMKPFPKNFLSLMTLSGAKGSQVNVSQISCLLGQQELEGRRVPVMFSGKTLPSFPPYDTRVRAGGYVGDRFLTGIRPQEYYFHCMAGREGLVDTAVKTSNSGYLQRCLIKHLEGLYVAYDYSVRDSDGSIVQFRYGEDCIDPMESKYLTKFDFLVSNLETIKAKYDYDTAMESNAYQIRPVKNYFKKKKKLEEEYEEKLRKRAKQSQKPKSEKVKVKKEVREEEEDEEEGEEGKKTEKTKIDAAETHEIEEISEEEFQRIVKEELPIKKEDLDPIISCFNPATHLGCVSETFKKELDQFLAKDPMNIFIENRKEDKKDEYNEHGIKYVEKKLFEKLMYIKYRRSLVNPGEAVGVVVGQSIGEPSTQMTLNTFHLAGHGGANVTLGIPRLREIIMTASENIKTPSMNLPLYDSCTREEAYDIANKFYRLTLPELLREITVSETVETTSTGFRIRAYKINLHFQPDEYLEKEHSLTFDDFADQLARSFSPVLHAAILKEIKTHCAGIDSQTATTTFFASAAGETGGDDADTEKDEKQVEDKLDANDADQVKKKKQLTSYEDSDEEEEVKTDASAEPVQLLGITLGDDEDEDDENLDFNEYGEPVKKSKEVVVSKVDGKKKPAGAAGAKGGRKLKLKSTAATSALSNLKFLKTYKCYSGENRILLVFNIPVSDKKLLMVSIVERVADSYVVNAIPGIKQCFVAEKEGKFAITTLGANIKEIWKYQDDIDINKIYSNDIYAIMKNYGIEAARASIISEVSSVFSAYGIKVDFRHLSLIADYMTFTGRYTACNRTHMDAKASPWTKMSFETTMKFLSEAAIAGQYDETKSPSSKIVVGSVVRGGTGYFDVLQPLT